MHRTNASIDLKVSNLYFFITLTINLFRISSFDDKIKKLLKYHFFRPILLTLATASLTLSGSARN